MRRRADGLTLIELLVVIAIITILAGFLLPALHSARERAQTAAGAAPVEPGPNAVFASDFEWPFDTPGGAEANGWSYEQVKPNAWTLGGAYLETTTDLAALGERALHCWVPDADPVSTAREGATSKAGLGYNEAQFTRDHIITMLADFYIPATSTGRITFFDIEDNRLPGNPGLRFQLEETWLRYNPDKIGYPVIKKPAVVPKDEWFRLTVEVTPGDRTSGRVRMWLDDVLIMDEQTATIIDQIQGYTSVQAGITARLDTRFELYMDNFAVFAGRNPAAA